MKIYTSYFAKAGQLKREGLLCISTATRIPDYLKESGILEFPQLGPSKDMLHLKREQYEPLYFEILNKLNAASLLKYLTDKSGGKDIALLCYESAADCESGRKYCHRHMLAKWFREKTGLTIEEYKFAETKSKKKEDTQQSLF